MLRAGILETRGMKVIVAVAAVLLLAAFQVAVQAKPAHAWEVSLSIKGAGKITEVTNKGLIASDCSPGGSGGLQSPNTTPTGQVGASCSPGSPSGGYNTLDIVEYKAEPKTGFSFVGWRNSDDGATYNPVLCDGSNNQPNYNGTNCRFQMFESLKAQAVFADTQDPSQPSVSGPSQPVNQSASFSFFKDFSDPTFKEFECRVQNVTIFQACGTGSSAYPVSVTGLADGNYTFQVQARDYSNNVSGIGSASFTVDKTAPITTINTGPADGTTTQDNDPTFTFSTNESVFFECNLIGPGFTSTAFGPCSTGGVTSGTRSYTNLKDGTYTFKVRARDPATNIGPDVKRTWTINNVPTVDPDSLMPAKGATNVSRTTDISATFSEEMASTSLKEADNTSKTFKLQMYNKKTKKWKTIPAKISLSLVGGKTMATLDPYGATEGTSTEQPLGANKKFRGFITTGVKDLDSNPLAKSFVWIFNTGSLVG